MAHADAVVAVASAARTTSGNSGPLIIVDKGSQVSLLADVTAVSGTTPSMTLSVEWSHDGTTFAAADPVDTHGAAITATAQRAKVYTVKGPYYRVVWAITGTTPSFTFSVRAYST